MKSIKSLLTLFSLLLATCSFSQQLNNKTWEILTNQGGTLTPVTYFQFSNDTVFNSANNTVYNAIATYQEIGNVFRILDMAPSPCGIDTGEYTFTINSNNLSFTLTQDNCGARATFFTNPGFTWRQLVTTGIPAASDQALEISVYPNPTSDILNIKGIQQSDNVAFELINQLGKVVYEGSLSQQDQTIDISHLPTGFYYLRTNDASKFTRKILKL